MTTSPNCPTSAQAKIYAAMRGGCALCREWVEPGAAYWPNFMFSHASVTHGMLLLLWCLCRCPSAAQRPDSVDVYIQHITESRELQINSIVLCRSQIAYVLTAHSLQLSGVNSLSVCLPTHPPELRTPPAAKDDWPSASQVNFSVDTDAFFVLLPRAHAHQLQHGRGCSRPGGHT